LFLRSAFFVRFVLAMHCEKLLPCKYSFGFHAVIMLYHISLALRRLKFAMEVGVVCHSE
jgi:hypothetical protein